MSIIRKSKLNKWKRYVQIFLSVPKNIDFMRYTLYTDKDRDGLNLFLELLNYTDDNVSDTDGDGYNDLTEIFKWL